MQRELNPRQQKFCLKYYELGSANEAARQAGYTSKHISSTVKDLLASPRIQSRLAELKEQLKENDKAAVMSIEERKARLSEIARARLTDFMEMGQDGTWLNIGKETPMSGAVEELRSRTEYDDTGAHPTIHTSVKLHDPMKAIDLLNKMEKLYSDGALLQDNSVHNRVVNIFVVDAETKDLISQVAQRTKLLGPTNDKSIQGDSESVGGWEETDQA